MVGRVAWAAMLAGAGRLATAFVDQSQSGSKDGAFRRHLLEAAVDHALDDGQLAWHVHSNPRGSLVYSNYTRKSAKNHGCEEKIANRGKQVTQAQSKLRLRSCKGATNPLFVRAGASGRARPLPSRRREGEAPAEPQEGGRGARLLPSRRREGEAPAEPQEGGRGSCRAAGGRARLLPSRRAQARREPAGTPDDLARIAHRVVEK